MSLSIGIVGLPNVGKSTLFNALTDSSILAANYPFATIEPNTGIVPIPDDRLNKLSELYKNAPIKPATVTFVDIAGLVEGASKGEGLGNQFLSHIRSCSAICQVVRVFSDPNVVRSEDSRDPEHDISIITTELVIADLQTINKRLPVMEKEAKSNPKLKPLADYARRVQTVLDSGSPLYAHQDIMEDDNREEFTRQLQLLTMKPIFYIFNVDESTLTNIDEQKKLASLVHPAPAVFVCAKLEDELRGLDEADRQEMLQSYGQEEPGLNTVIKTAYQLLGLQSYLTAGEQEVRAWTIKQNATAPQAAGVIHTDFEKGFIAAEVVSYPDLMAAGSLTAARAAGKVVTAGKTYTMQPDDIVEFKFNV